MKCPDCDQGVIHRGFVDSPCPTCAGTGRVPEQFDPEEARRRTNEGIARAISKADAEWKAQALAAWIDLAYRQRFAIADDFWKVVPKPDQPSAAGWIFRYAAKQGYWRRTGEFRRSESVTAHQKPLPVWESTVYEGTR